MRQVIEYDLARQPVEHVLGGQRRRGRRVELHVPSHRRDPLRHRLQHVHGGGAAGGGDVEPHAAHPGGIEPLQFGVADAVIDHRDAARRRPAFAERLDEAVVEDAVGRGLHDHVAAGADPLLQQPIVRNRGIARPQRRIGIDLEARRIDVMMAVGGVRWRLGLRRCRADRPRHLLRLRGRQRRAGRRCAHHGQHGPPIPILPRHRRLPLAPADLTFDACCADAYKFAREGVSTRLIRFTHRGELHDGRRQCQILFCGFAQTRD